MPADTGSGDPLVESPNTIARARRTWTIRSVSNARRYFPGEILDRLAYPLQTISQPAFTPGYGIHKNINCYGKNAQETHFICKLVTDCNRTVMPQCHNMQTCVDTYSKHNDSVVERKTEKRLRANYFTLSSSIKH